MKWTPISKAKVKFGQLYLIKTQDQRPATGYLYKSETTQAGILHTFDTDTNDTPVAATHVAIVNEPGEKDL